MQLLDLGESGIITDVYYFASENWIDMKVGWIQLSFFQPKWKVEQILKGENVSKAIIVLVETKHNKSNLRNILWNKSRKRKAS